MAKTIADAIKIKKARSEKDYNARVARRKPRRSLKEYQRSIEKSNPKFGKWSRDLRQRRKEREELV